MTEKEEKAIEMLNKFILEHKFYNIKESDNLEGNIDTVIQALEKRIKNQKILAKEYRKIAKQLNCEVKDNLEKSKEIEQLKADLYECNNIISDYIDTVKENDKVIDLMVKHIANEDTSGSFCVIDKYDCTVEECQECILKYFKRKASEENDIF